MHATAKPQRAPRRPPSKRPSSSNKSNRKRRALAKRPKLSNGQRFLFFAKWSAIVGLVCGALGIIVISALFWHFGSDDKLPKIASVSDYRPNQVVRVVTADGKAVGEIYKERRTFVPFEKIPKHVIGAFIAAEDAGFYEHKGIDYLGMLRALFVNIKSGEKKQGASTITQQVVKNLLLSPERTYKRKFQEIILARRLEKELSKEEILTLYANVIFFGHGRYGIQEAARYYFGKNVGELNAGEAAVLAGLPKGPNNYSPKKKKNAKRAKDRQTYVLTQMVRAGFITESEGQKFVDEPIRVIGNPYPTIGDAPEWLEVARAELEKKLGPDEIYKVGGNVVTTLDLRIQKAGRQAVQEGLREVDKRQGYGHPIKTISVDKIELEVLKLEKRLPKSGPKPGEIYRAIVREVHPRDGELVVDLGKWRAAVKVVDDDPRYNPEKKKLSERFVVGHLVKVMVPKADAKPKAAVDDSDDSDEDEAEKGKAKAAATPIHAERLVTLATGPEGALVVIDIATREVLGLVGGYDVGAAHFNRATMAKRQAGSTFKPFVYAAAIDVGGKTAASIVNDTPQIFDLWRPQNYAKGKFAGPVRLRHALAKSINTVAIAVANDVGVGEVVSLARRMGIESDLPAHLSLSLGSGEVTPLELTNAFASFAAGGRSSPPVLIKRIGDQVIPRTDPVQAVRPEVAYIVLDMMRSVVNGGTGGRARALRMDVAGKTGTSNDARDAWFVGVTPTLAVGAWVGFDDFGRPLGRGEGGSKAALPIYVKAMKKIAKNKSRRFSRPAGLLDVRIDKETGLLAPDGVTGETVYSEVFLPGTAPTEFAARPDEVNSDDFAIDQYDDDDDEVGTAYDDDDEEDEED